MKMKTYTKHLALFGALLFFFGSGHIHPQKSKNSILVVNNASEMHEALKYTEKNLLAIYELLQRYRVLAVRGASFTYSPHQRESIHRSGEALQTEILHIIRHAKYKDFSLLNYTDSDRKRKITLVSKKKRIFVFVLPQLRPYYYGLESWQDKEEDPDRDIWYIDSPGVWNERIGDTDAAMAQLDQEVIRIRTMIIRVRAATQIDEK